MTDLFDILGPTMVGPSSSHTAGACRLGYVVHAVLGGPPDRARIQLHGSFAMTGEGHGTKKAILGGLMGYLPDDERIRTSPEAADEAEMDHEFESVDLGEDVHPNSVRFRASRDGADDVQVLGSSVGGGQIRVWRIDGFDVDLSGALPTLLVHADDVPGTVAEITGLLADHEVNIATLRVDRTGRGEHALTTVEADEPVPDAMLAQLRAEPWAHWVRHLESLVDR